MTQPNRHANVTTDAVGHYINGQYAAGGSRRAPITNPSTGEATGIVMLADKSTTNRAIEAAAAAFASWREVTPVKRARILFQYKRLLEEHFDEIAALITAEHGKVLSDAKGELQRGIEVVEYACAAPELLKGEYSRNAGPGIDTWSVHQPLGVVAGVTPFNFPAMVPMWMFPMAIACGNTFVLKPSEQDPGAAMILAKLFTEAGLPDGVLNVVNGDKQTVDILLSDRRIQAVSFVGSTPVAEYIYSTGAANGKRVQALGGAKNIAIVMPDADIDNAANALMGAAYGSCGERCMAISAAICVGDTTATAIVGALSDRLSQLRIGDGFENGSEMGPLISEPHRARVLSYVDLGVAEGATLVVDGRNHVVPGHEQGYFLGGCLFDDVQANMRIFREEIFGPVLCVVRVASQQQAMQLIDNHEYGNGTCIFTRDGEAARFFADRINVGMVGINVPLPVPVASHSFGGWKRSLFGDLAAYGPDSIRFYTRRKTVTQSWPASSVRGGANFAFPTTDA